MSDWIEWHGGECPVDRDALVEIRCIFRDDGKPLDRVGDDTAGWFDTLGWWGRGARVCIVAYRVAASNDNNPDHAAAINALAAHLHAKSTAAGWWKGVDATDPYVAATKLMLIVSEVSEAMEGMRKDLMDDKLPHRKMGEVELADALIRICDLAAARGYDLGGAVVEKVAYNSVREDHKPEARAVVGGKRF